MELPLLMLLLVALRRPLTTEAAIGPDGLCALYMFQPFHQQRDRHYLLLGRKQDQSGPNLSRCGPAGGAALQRPRPFRRARAVRAEQLQRAV